MRKITSGIGIREQIVIADKSKQAPVHPVLQTVDKVSIRMRILVLLDPTNIRGTKMAYTVSRENLFLAVLDRRLQHSAP